MTEACISEKNSKPPRRPRYAGTHPRQFSERYKELNPDAFPELQQHVREQGRTPAGTHVPVMLEEVLARLAPKPGETVADCTLGFGGHALEFLKRIAPGGRLIGLDVDAAQLERATARLHEAMRLPDWNPPSANSMTNDSGRGSATEPPVPLRIHRSHFAGLGKILAHEGAGLCDIIFADLGVSSMQIDDPARGFSYKHDGPLDMRMDARLPQTAAEWLARLSVEELAAHLFQLADEPDAERIAKAIVNARTTKPIKRTGELVDIVFIVKGMSRRAWRERPPSDRGKLHPAARTFQALRILVNDEMNGLGQFLRIAPYCLKPGGRIGIISFHSGEEQLVKNSWPEGLESGVYSSICDQGARPSADEVAKNPRSRSAVFRWAVRQ
jgi:16S rRNA (cytosine1402-N4)-methyltransferase